MFLNLVEKYILFTKNIFIDRFTYKYIIMCIFLCTISLSSTSFLLAQSHEYPEDSIKLFMNDIPTKKTFIKYWLNYLTSDKEDANAYFRLFRIDNKKTDSCLGYVFFIETSTSDIILIPAMKKEFFENGILAVDLLNIISSYTGYDTFLVQESFFNNKIFSAYSKHSNYLQKQSYSSLYAKVKSKDIYTFDYEITNLEEDLPLFLKISLSVLTGANSDIESQLHHIKSFGLLDISHVSKIEEKVSTYKNYSINHNILVPSILDYIEAALLLTESEQTIPKDPTPSKKLEVSNTDDEITSRMFPISKFYVDILNSTDISAASVYKMFKRKFFNTETLAQKLFNFSDHSVGIEILDQIFSNLEYKNMLCLKNNMIIFDGINILSYIIDKKTSYVIDSKYSNALLFKLYSKPKFDIEIDNVEKFLSSYHEDISQKLYSTLPAKKSILRNLILSSDTISSIVIRTVLNIYASISYNLSILDIELLSSFIDSMIERDNSDLSSSDILFVILKLDNIANGKIKKLGKTSFQEVRDLLIKISTLKSQLLKMDSSSLKCINFFIP